MYTNRKCRIREKERRKEENRGGFKHRRARTETRGKDKSNEIRTGHHLVTVSSMVVHITRGQ